MRRFHSYGPVDLRDHFGVERRALVDRCVEQLIGAAEGGHYFTIWAPRQTGKTWIMRRAVEEIRARHSDRFVIATMSMQGIAVAEDAPPEAFFDVVPALFERFLGISVPRPARWDDVGRLFLKQSEHFDRPLILLIDEFDSLPRSVIDQLVRQFRDLYLARDTTLLHGLALIGVRAVLGVENRSGSPFNVQRSFHVPPLSAGEVGEMFEQYQGESGQRVEPEVVDRLFAATRGQPGLVGWFGELLTETYNPGAGRPIDVAAWQVTYAAACQIEPNNTVLNLISKAKGPYREHVVRLFANAEVPFHWSEEWCNHLYLNGIIDHEQGVDEEGRPLYRCRFSSPFVQLQLYNALSRNVLTDPESNLALDPLDDLGDVFSPAGLDLPALLGRYRAYLGRLRAQGIDPFAGEPRRRDLHHREAPGHFHLYAWLLAALGRRCHVSPEFPTGNGKVDLVLRWRDRMGVIEVKSFTTMHDLGLARRQAAGYAAKLGLQAATLAVFVPKADEAVLEKLSGRAEVDGVEVVTAAIGWG